MSSRTVIFIVAGAFALCCGAALVVAQADTAAAHRAIAKNVAGQDFQGLLRTICPEPAAPGAGGQSARGAGAAARGRGAAPAAAGGARGTAAPAPRPSPPREQWHAEPAKVFDNLYFLGQTEYSVWAVNTSDGIIIIDTIFDYSVEDEVVGGLKKMGLDPAKIKYVIVSHGHSDHSGGAKFLQETFKARVLMSAADWDLLDRNPNQVRPRRDMVVTDGQKLTLGGTTLTMYLTPGHTPGTISTIIPVTDNGQPHVMAEWGGTAFNFTVSPDKPRDYWFRTYIASAEHFLAAARQAGADGVIANHLNFDESKRKLPMLATRKPGNPNPYVVGQEAVQRYLTIAEECAKAGLAELEGRQ